MKDMLAIYRGYHEPIESLISNTQSSLKLNISDIQSLPKWHDGRVLLIGDAAHAVSPNAGQGASIALEDAMYLAKLLRDSSAAMKRSLHNSRAIAKRAEKIVAEGPRSKGTNLIVGYCNITG